MRVIDNVGFDVKKQDIPGGGRGNGQPLATPDYLQNDETAADYIKNRPFYTTDPVETELVNGTFAFAPNSSFSGLYTTDGVTIDLIEGEIYKVTIDGVEYETECQVERNVKYIGSLELTFGGTPNYPFLYAPGQLAFTTNIEGDSHEIVILSPPTKIDIKLPNRYLDDSLFLNPDYLQSDSSQADYIKNRPCHVGDTSNISMDNVLHTFISGNTYSDNFSGGFSIQQDQDFAYVRGSITFSEDTSGTNAITKNIDGYYPLVISPINCYIDTGELYVFYKSDREYAYLERIYASNDVAYGNKLGFFGICSTTKYYITAEIEITPMKKLDSMCFDINGKEANYLVLKSSTSDSTKKFKITVDDSGTLKATEVTG